MASPLAFLNPFRLFARFNTFDYVLVAAGAVLVVVPVVVFLGGPGYEALFRALAPRGPRDSLRAAFYATVPVGLGLIGFPFCRRSSASQMMAWSLLGLLFMIGFFWVIVTDAMGQERGGWGPFSAGDLAGMCGGFFASFCLMFAGLLVALGSGKPAAGGEAPLPNPADGPTLPRT